MLERIVRGEWLEKTNLEEEEEPRGARLESKNITRPLLVNLEKVVRVRGVLGPDFQDNLKQQKMPQAAHIYCYR